LTIFEESSSEVGKNGFTAKSNNKIKLNLLKNPRYAIYDELNCIVIALPFSLKMYVEDQASYNGPFTVTVVPRY
jgi:hypothetical protein